MRVVQDRRKSPTDEHDGKVVIVPARVPHWLARALLVLFLALIACTSVGGFALAGQAHKAQVAAAAARVAATKVAEVQQQARLLEVQLVKNCQSTAAGAVKFNKTLDQLITNASRTRSLTDAQKVQALANYAGLHQVVPTCPPLPDLSAR